MGEAPQIGNPVFPGSAVFANGHAVEGTTKNHQRRSVPIPRFFADELAARGPADARSAQSAPSSVVVLPLAQRDSRPYQRAVG